ncbi:MAG: NADH-quinone oxidoreductase subunit J [Methylacidiphilales bacterium]|nr:NADH-quinone oxidoreductase subunit J [Candidatus Methylacidiphilales bacterium]
MILSFLLYSLIALTLLSSILVVFSRNPVFSVLALIATSVCVALIWLLLQFEFLAITMIVVYVGAVMVLFLFVVMFLDIDVSKMLFSYKSILPIGLVLPPLFLIVLLTPFFYNIIDELHLKIFEYLLPSDHSNTLELGKELFGNFTYVFILSGLVLLLAIVIAISLTLRRRKSVSYLSPEKQISVSSKNRVSLIKDMSP